MSKAIKSKTALLIYFIFSSLIVTFLGIYKYRKYSNDFFLRLIIAYFFVFLISCFTIRRFLPLLRKFSRYELLILWLGFTNVFFILLLGIILHGKKTNININHSDIVFFLMGGSASAYFVWYFYLRFLRFNR